jgi:hypothetical protein
MSNTLGESFSSQVSTFVFGFGIKEQWLMMNAGLAKFQANICKAPIQDRSHIIVSVFIAIVTVSAVMIFLRFVNGSLKGNRVGLEDWTSLAALVCLNCYQEVHAT